MRKADRLFELTNIIRARQPVTAEELAQELGLSVRTIYRYIDDLSATGIPIYGVAGVGYKLHQKFELPPLNLTDKEVDALLLGVRMVSSWTSDELSESARTLENKIKAALPNRLVNEYERAAYAPNLLRREKERENWEAIHGAVKKSNTVFIEYDSLGGEHTTRIIYPLGLFYWGGKWTVGSWCALRESYRDFRLDRIINIRVNDEKYQKGEVISLESYFESVKKSVYN